MTSRTLRRRLHHGDVDGRRYEHLEAPEVDGLDEPLLGNRKEDYIRNSEDCALAALLDEGRSKEHLHWALLFSQVIAQWAQWLANIVLGSGSFIGRFLPFSSAPQDRLTQRISPPLLSPLQEARLKHLKQRLAVPFDGSFLEHQDALRQLWRLSYPDRELPSPKSELWKDMGWQGTDPSTDFRGGGYISLENMIFFAKTYPMLDLQSGKPTNLAGIHFLELLAEDDMAFDNLFCIAFQLLDAQWLAKRASYMEFNDVLKSTRTQLERELALEDINSIKDLPSYNLLRR